MTHDSSTSARVLLVDDDPFITALYRERLIKQGMVVETAQNGEDALTQVQAFQPNIMLLDLNMPRMDGTEVLRYVREQSPTPDLPIVVLSNACAPEFIAEVSQLRPTRFLVKYDNAPNKVVDTLLQVLDEAHQGHPPTPAPAQIHADEPRPPANVDELLSQLRQVASLDEQRTCVLALYRALQATLEHFQTLPPLSLPFLLEDALEPLLEKMYTMEQLARQGTLQALGSAVMAIQQLAPAPPTTPVPTAHLILHAAKTQTLSTWRERLDRPGFIPSAVAQPESAYDLLTHNPYCAIIWESARWGASRKVLKRLQSIAAKARCRVVIILPDDEADRGASDSDAADAAILGTSYASEALPPLLYAWQQ